MITFLFSHSWASKARTENLFHTPLYTQPHKKLDKIEKTTYDSIQIAIICLTNFMIMNTKEKKEKLLAIKNCLSRGLMSGGFVKNVDNVFFTFLDCGCVLRDVVYYDSIRYGLDFEALSLDSQYFVGSREHAEALKEYYGGRVYASEYCHVARAPRELWIWEAPILPKYRGEHNVNLNPMDYEEAMAVIFNIV